MLLLFLSLSFYYCNFIFTWFQLFCPISLVSFSISPLPFFFFFSSPPSCGVLEQQDRSLGQQHLSPCVTTQSLFTVARFTVSLVKGGLVVEGSLWLRPLGFQHASLVLESGKTGGQE